MDAFVHIRAQQFAKITIATLEQQRPPMGHQNVKYLQKRKSSWILSQRKRYS